MDRKNSLILIYKHSLISYRSITAIDLLNAWHYAENHSEEIETEIQENNTVMDEAI